MEKFGKILVVDDNADVLFTINNQLAPRCEWVRVAYTPERALMLCKKYSPDVVLMDMNFTRDAVSGEEGFQLLRDMLKIDKTLAIIMMTAYSDTPKVVRAIKAGATDFLPKPWERSQLMAMLSSAMRLKGLGCGESPSRAQSSGTSHTAPEIIGESESMQQLLSLAREVAKTDANILILGENGTGKDVLAQYIYRHSLRNGKPFVGIDLGAVPETLFEGELFGYERGAFTGALSAKAGRMESANGGTLFLDEIGNLRTEIQAKLLTCIEKRQCSRLGSTKVVPIDVRLICATNIDIHRAVAEGAFRQDLLYRINTIELRVPPVRERITDIPLLAKHFTNIYARKYSKNITGLSAELLKRLKEYSWPGNVRELQHLIERGIILCKKSVIGTNDLPADSFNRLPSANPEDTLDLETVERISIERALARCEGNVSRASKLLGITRFMLYRKMEKYGI
ncbi:MAG: sigma-54-dependent Fis family transcriptional regulator [Bacteroidaceae bacterium]|nr:sigma-54-dependent Fis family transcriptional regulator [Bacteroidaceae bacterium]